MARPGVWWVGLATSLGTPAEEASDHTQNDQTAAETFESNVNLQDGARLRRVRVVRDYGMFDRREAPQYYPDARGRQTIHD